MTYRQLLRQLARVPDARLDDDVTVAIKLGEPNYGGEAYKAEFGIVQEGSDMSAVLDEGHIILAIEL